MKKLITTIVTVSFSLATFAETFSNQSETCLVSAKKLRTQALTVRYHEETLQNYKELADDSRRTSNISFGLFTISSAILNGATFLPGTILKAGSIGEKIVSAPLMVTSKFSNLFTYSSVAVGDIAMLTGLTLGLVSTFSPTIVSIGNGIYRLKTKSSENDIFIDYSTTDLNKILVDSDFLIAKVIQERNQVDLNYSRLMNVITLGEKDASTMKKLYELTKLEHELLKLKLTVYSAIHSQCN